MIAVRLQLIAVRLHLDCSRIAVGLQLDCSWIVVGCLIAVDCSFYVGITYKIFSCGQIPEKDGVKVVSWKDALLTEGKLIEKRPQRAVSVQMLIHGPTLKKVEKFL